MMLIIAFIIFFGFLLLGTPIAFAMGLGSAISVLFLGGAGMDANLIIGKLYSGVNSFSLMAIPFFMLAGELMESGGISERLINIAKAFVGHITGGIGMVDIATSTLFAGISGSSAADTAAVGALLIPSMKDNGYPKGLAAVIQACAGALGPIIPPSLTMIIYCSLTNLSISACFMAGIVPGILIALSIGIVTYFYAKKLGIKGDRKATGKECLRAIKEGALAIIMPIIIIGGIVTGMFTPTESGAIAVIYALIVSMFVYKELKIKDLKGVFVRAAGMTSMSMLIVASASIFSFLVAYCKFPAMVVDLMTSITDSPYIIMILLVLFLLFMGMFIETLSATIICAPILFPVAAAYGIDQIQFAMVMVITLVYAAVTPPVGGSLFITMGIAECKMKDTLRYLTPYLLAIFAIVALCIFVPQVTLLIPNLLYG